MKTNHKRIAFLFVLTAILFTPHSVGRPNPRPGDEHPANQFIAMLRDSLLVSVAGVWALMFLARTLGLYEFKHLEMLITAALIYWALSIVFGFIQSRIEPCFGKAELHR